MMISIEVNTIVASKNGTQILTCSWQKQNAPRNACGTKWIPADYWSIAVPKKAVVPETEVLDVERRNKKLCDLFI